MNDVMLQATLLTRANRLTEATALLQRMLRRDIITDTRADTSDDGDLRRKSRSIDLEEATTDQKKRSRLHATKFARPDDFLAQRDFKFLFERNLEYGLPQWRQPAPDAAMALVPKGGKFIEASYRDAAGSRTYKLYVPSRYQGQALPLVVMLHGGTQTPDDFAVGTRMNVIAEEHDCLVAYPAQPSHANPAKCWNWFRPNDQRRGQGEPSLIAGITQKIMNDYAVDPHRVYVCGLSAGAAAAAVMGETYPDLYAAIGVHSGLACGAANDLPSAFVAMRQGDLGCSPEPGDTAVVPTIVFHGDQDIIVHPRNADHVITHSMKSTKLNKKVRCGQVPGGHAYTRTIFTDASGRPMLEQWCIHGAGHAWSGGSPGGSYTDPLGPDAAREMLHFFLDHPADASLLPLESVLSDSVRYIHDR